MANRTTVKNTQIHVGDTVRVFYRIIEKEEEAGKTKKEVNEKTRERLQPYEGLVIAIRNVGENQSFIVRRIGESRIGIERIFPVVSPWIEKVTVVKQGLVKRAKLYYVRQKAASQKIKNITEVSKKPPAKSTT